MQSVTFMPHLVPCTGGVEMRLLSLFLFCLMFADLAINKKIITQTEPTLFVFI
jgi:hypothetical protein